MDRIVILIISLSLVSLRAESHKTHPPQEPDNFCGLNYRLTNGGSERIVGGRNASEDEFPWMVSIQHLISFPFDCNQTIDGIDVPFNCTINMWSHTCGGALLNSQTILTAAHCDSKNIKDKKILDLRILAGCRDAASVLNNTGSICQVAKFTPDEFISHPGFLLQKNNRSGITGIADDIAIIRLKNEKFRFNNRKNGAVGAICLPHPNPQAVPGQMVSVAGWGNMEDPKSKIPDRQHLIALSKRLKTVNMRIKRQDYCHRYLNNDTSADVRQFFCTYSATMYQGACVGDSGGPAMMIDRDRYYVVGVVSFSGACGRGYFYPEFFTRVDRFLHWINHMKDPW